MGFSIIMPSQKVVFVIGAGASKEVELPTGRELKTRIASILNFPDGESRNQKKGDDLVYEALRYHAKPLIGPPVPFNKYLHACWRIRDAMPLAPSIDNFLDVHQGNQEIELCGKLAIVRSILEAEKGSLLSVSRNNGREKVDFKRIENSWFNSFFQLLHGNCKIDKISERLAAVSLIVFNYDRCVEHFLCHAFQNYYAIDDRSAADLVNKIEIYHPYGKVGDLVWQVSQNPDKSMPYGVEADAKQLLSLSRGIRTFSEGTDPKSSEIVAIRQRINQATTIVFLGFAFHHLNLELLKTPNVPKSRSATVKYFGTAKGISESDCALIRMDLGKLRKCDSDSIQIRDLECHQLFHEFRRSLEFN